jgi:hypothetical protein
VCCERACDAWKYAGEGNGPVVEDRAGLIGLLTVVFGLVEGVDGRWEWLGQCR